VSRGIGWSTTKVSRAESGRESLPASEVEKLVDYYGVVGSLRTRLLELAEDANQRGWWEEEEFAVALTPEYLDFIGLEAEATSSLNWQIDVVPGLFQVEDYARALNAAWQTVVPTTPPGVFERFLRARMRRQERLVREPVLHLSVILDEAVLLRQVGDNRLMRTQLAHLVNMAELPNVEVRVLPLHRKVALGAASFVILTFGNLDEPDVASLGDVVSTESLSTELYVEGEGDTHIYRLFFDALSKIALPPRESRDRIVTIADQAWSLPRYAGPLG
jgi:hypothetical protein